MRAWLARGRLSLVPAAAIFALLFALPLCWFLVISFWSVRSFRMRPGFSVHNYAETLTGYGDTLAHTLLLAFGVAVTTTLLAFLLAYAIRFKLGRWAEPCLFAVLVTLFGGYLVKVYAWKSILGTEGVLNQALLGLGVIRAPLSALLYSANGVVITLTCFLLPFAVLPIYGSLRAIRDVTVEAARDMGAGRWAVMRDIVLPACESGVLTAFTLSFLVAVGDYVTPRFVGGGAALMGTFIENQFSIAFNWPLGSAMAFTTMGAALLVVVGVRWLLRAGLRA